MHDNTIFGHYSMPHALYCQPRYDASYTYYMKAAAFRYCHMMMHGAQAHAPPVIAAAAAAFFHRSPMRWPPLISKMICATLELLRLFATELSPAIFTI